jgi:hypothetical protein
VLAGGAGLAGALIVVGCTLTCRPAWYNPASIDYSRLKADKRELVGLVDDIGAALNGWRAIDLELQEDQINRWITARAEIWPDSQTSLEPLRRPQITLLDGNRVRAAASVEWAGLEPIVSCTCRFELKDEQLTVICDTVRVGVLPAPRGWVAKLVGKLVASSNVVRDTNGDTGLTFRNEWVWPNGKRRFCLRRLEVSAGRAAVRLEPITGGR